jgi:hypothetical protein
MMELIVFEPKSSLKQLSTIVNSYIFMKRDNSITNIRLCVLCGMEVRGQI